jgi:hypothetical protein
VTASRYRKRPVQVEAMRFTGDNLSELIQWADDEAEPAEGPASELVVETLHGDVRAMVGDWIVRGPAGDIWPVAAHLFDQLYEPVEA